jgi:elongator complex protein 3
VAKPHARHRSQFKKNTGKVTLVFYNRPRPCGGACKFCILTPGFTKSTTRNEDTLLARNCGWDATCQIKARFNQYDLPRGRGFKYGLAVKGDSFTNHDPDYLRGYFKALYDYLNGQPSGDFDEARSLQRDAPDRCVWVQIETRPDQITEEWCERLSQLGVNCVEIGVQCLDDDVLAMNRRGHGTDAVRAATRLLRDQGFEVGYHMMVGLPGSSDDLDYEVLAERLWEPQYSPDTLKIYPCLLLKDHSLQPQLVKFIDTPMWNPLTDERYLELLSAVFPRMPSTVTINRIQRIVAAEDVDLGPKNLIDRKRFDGMSRCLWQRSVARADEALDGFDDYTVSSLGHGTGYCVEATLRGRQVILGYGRLTIDARGIGLIRDLRVIGDMVPLGERTNTSPQHTGIGKAMVAEIERLAAEQRCTLLRVQPPVGSFRYFEPLGFRTDGPFHLAKRLDSASSLHKCPSSVVT